jgi:hypothetical protein
MSRWREETSDPVYSSRMPLSRLLLQSGQMANKSGNAQEAKGSVLMATFCLVNLRKDDQYYAYHTGGVVRRSSGRERTAC